MAAEVPLIRQVAWISLVPQLLFMGLLIGGCYVLGAAEPFIIGSLLYLLLSRALRTAVPRFHRQGIHLVRQQKFAEAIPLFERSLAFFAKYSWVDRYRFLTLLSSSKLSYREMGLCNIAFCYTQVGEGQVAKQRYEHILKEYPSNVLASLGLTMLNSVNSPNGK